jgi:GNAT superfamily N-acetyltransferase
LTIAEGLYFHHNVPGYNILATMGNVTIRLFVPGDTEAVAALLHDMSVHYHGPNASSYNQVRENLVTNILGVDSGVRLVVATHDDGVVAMAAIALLYPAPKEKGQLFMKELYVRTGRRGEGIGEHLVRWIANYALERHCSRFDWTVDASNLRAVEFYSALGAVPSQDKLYYRVADDALKSLAKKSIMSFSLTKDWALTFAQEWVDAWNSHDLDRILSHYTDDFEMRSPLIVERMNVPSGVLRGKDQIRPYWAKGLQAQPPILFELRDVYVGASSIAITYLSVGRGVVTEVVIFDDVGKIASGNAMYAGS